ncbi:unknown [Prevotella sp. CAG:891]|nr:unknown [Prevotella sp. CAG:891]
MQGIFARCFDSITEIAVIALIFIDKPFHFSTVCIQKPNCYRVYFFVSKSIYNQSHYIVFLGMCVGYS